MRIETVHIVAALTAAVAFTLAFIAAGAVLLSMLFGLIGAGAVAWLTFLVARRWLDHRQQRDAPPIRPST